MVLMDDAVVAVAASEPKRRRRKRRFIWPFALAAVLSLASWTLAQAATLPPLPVDDSASGTLVTDAAQAPVDAPMPSAAPVAFGPQLEVILPPPPPPPPPAPRKATSTQRRAAAASASTSGITTAQYCDAKYGATSSASSLDGLLTAANAERARFGLGALSWSGSLATAAQDWSNAMAANSDPASPGTALAHNPGRPSGGENVAAAWTTGTGYAQSTAMSKAHSGWMASPGHCANILRASFTTMGAGTASGPDGKAWYTTVDFQ